MAAAGIPILVGTITDGPGPNERQTASLWWHPSRGVEARYDKRNIVPFGEWVPYREFLEPLFPVVSYVGAQSVAGTKPGVLAVTLDDGRGVRVGDLICFDVAYGETVYDTVRHGAQVLIVQSSNAMYTGTGQIHQQFAITRARAAELRREILVVTTTGTSGLINPDGSVVFTAPEAQPVSGVLDLPLRDNVTPATWLAPILDAGLPVITLVALAGTLTTARRRSPTP
ncbi:MAG: apolipoprotein N-acyltransferase [Micropruina sp.]|nr:apolipoprotein N-acyltransferase [Micropruina sp.]